MAQRNEPDDQDSAPAALAELLRRAGAGEDVAWRELLGLYSRRVYALAVSRLRDPEGAEEITQSVFVTVSQHLQGSQYSEEGRFESWLFRIAANRVRDEVRRRARVGRNESDHDLSQIPIAREKDGPDEQSVQSLRRALDALSQEDREVIELRHHAGLAFKEIAGALEQPVGTVLARHHRALAKLRDAMQADQRGGQ